MGIFSSLFVVWAFLKDEARRPSLVSAKMDQTKEQMRLAQEQINATVSYGHGHSLPLLFFDGPLWGVQMTDGKVKRTFTVIQAGSILLTTILMLQPDEKVHTIFDQLEVRSERTSFFRGGCTFRGILYFFMVLPRFHLFNCVLISSGIDTVPQVEYGNHFQR